MLILRSQALNYDQRKMLFKNRKRIILDRGPSWPDYDKAEAFVVRYYLLFRKRQVVPFLHDHYWSYITIILKGGYWETTEKGTFWRRPGYVGFRRRSDRHSLKIPEGKPAWTLLFVGSNKGSKQYSKYSKNS